MTKAVQRGAVVPCFLIAQWIIQFTCTVDQASALGGVVSVASMFDKKICVICASNFEGFVYHPKSMLH